MIAIALALVLLLIAGYGFYRNHLAAHADGGAWLFVLVFFLFGICLIFQS
jgi:hypothetical protein